MRAPILWALLFACCAAQAQYTPQLRSVLDPALAENSGILYLGDALWAHTDGNGPAALMRIDPATGQIIRTLTFSNATNVDWEDVTSDGTHVYIGDFGNNAGDRSNLRVFRFPVDSLLDPLVEVLTVDTIAFHYSLQTDFTPTQFSTNWDMEAMIALDDTLFLFSRNWGDQQTYLYALPTTPGHHALVARDTLNAGGLISGADIDPGSGRIVLTGLAITLPFEPFIWTLEHYPGHALFDGINTRSQLTVGGIQVEGVAFRSSDTLYLSNETYGNSLARLWDLSLALATGPPPSAHAPALFLAEHPWGWQLQHPQAAQLQVLDSSGRLLQQHTLAPGEAQALQRAQLPAGPLLLVISGAAQRTTRMVVNW